MNAPRALLRAAIVLALALPAAAAEALQLRDGSIVAGRVVALDDDGVTFAPESGGEMRVRWERVLPLSRYELWQSTLSSDDAAGRVALGKWAHSAGLHYYARRELQKAKGLGYEGGEDLGSLIAAVDRDEADDAIADADALVAEGELEKALERLRAYVRIAPPGEHADRAKARVPDVLARIEARDAQEREAEAARSKAEKAGKLKDWLDRTFAAARKQADDAGTRAASGYAELAKGNQTRARAELTAAETGFQGARKQFLRVRKAAGAGETADSCDRHARDCDRRTVEVLIRWGRMEVENKAWKRASPIVDRGLKIDPVDRELLELRRTIDENWIRRRLSDVTNAHPRESN